MVITPSIETVYVFDWLEYFKMAAGDIIYVTGYTCLRDIYALQPFIKSTIIIVGGTLCLCLSCIRQSE